MLKQRCAKAKWDTKPVTHQEYISVKGTGQLLGQRKPVKAQMWAVPPLPDPWIQEVWPGGEF